MVVSVIPVQQAQPVKAAAGDMIPAGTTIYLRPNAATTWISDGAVMAFKTSANNKQSEIVVMTMMVLHGMERQLQLRPILIFFA